MLKTSFQIVNELSQKYKSPKNRLMLMEKKGIYHKVVKGLYETESSVNPLLLASAVYGPSYVSFESALSFWNLIPEKVMAVTSATFNKNKTKRFETDFGLFLYRDVPESAFPFEVYICEDDGRNFLIAGKEKSLCDILYREEPLHSEKRLCEYLFENLRIEQSDFELLDFSLISDLCGMYKSTNLKLLQNLVNKRGKNYDNTCSADD